MKSMLLFCVLVTVNSMTFAARGPSCGEYGGCSGGLPVWMEWALGGGFVILLVYGAYRSHGIVGVIPIVLWFGGIYLCVLLASQKLVPIWLFIIPFTGVWWFDPVLKALGLRGKDYEP